MARGPSLFEFLNERIMLHDPFSLLLVTLGNSFVLIYAVMVMISRKMDRVLMGFTFSLFVAVNGHYFADLNRQSLLPWNALLSISIFSILARIRKTGSI